MFARFEEEIKIKIKRENTMTWGGWASWGEGRVETHTCKRRCVSGLCDVVVIFFVKRRVTTFFMNDHFFFRATTNNVLL